MPSHQSWPRGLKAVFCLVVFGLVVGIGQTLYWLLVTHEFFPRLTVQGGYAALALVLAIACVALGTLGHRRAFAITSLVTAALHIGVTAFFDLDILRMWLPDILAGRWQSLLSWDVNSWVYAWNSIGIAINAFVCYYLLRYEVRFFGSA